jgi:hypothetical protein
MKIFGQQKFTSRPAHLFRAVKTTVPTNGPGLGPYKPRGIEPRPLAPVVFAFIFIKNKGKNIFFK